MRCVRYAIKSIEEVCLQCWEYSHAYRFVDKRGAETAALWGSVPLSCERLACSKMCLVAQRDVYGASRLKEALSGSLSVSSMRHVLGIGRLGSFGGDVGE